LREIRAFFAPLMQRDASGRSWLPRLIAAAPYGERRLGHLLDNPGSLLSTLAVKTPDGSLGAFEHPIHPPRELVTWYVEHPEALTWPPHTELSREAEMLRRALLDDDPPGARARAQERARELMEMRSALSQEWWRFEEMVKPDCVLITDRVAIVVLGARGASFPPATAWYPARSELVRTIEAGSQLAFDREWAALVISEEPLAEASYQAVVEALPAGAPHLSPAQRDELVGGYLGNLTWAAARAAVGSAQV
jgi:hypothetical protein